ncbi:MAG: hypothetical protein QXJ94_05675 [Candidatus Bathyarchaeia archaeon]
MVTDNQIKAAILLKLYKRGNWGGSHTAFDNLKKGFKAKELGKGGLKRIDDAGRALIREGLLLAKPTSYGLQVSLNPKQTKAIKAIITSAFPEFQ